MPTDLTKSRRPNPLCRSAITLSYRDSCSARGVSLQWGCQWDVDSGKLVGAQVPGRADPDGPLLGAVLRVVIAAARRVRARRQSGRGTDSPSGGRAWGQRVGRGRERRTGATHSSVDLWRGRREVVVPGQPDRRGLTRGWHGGPVAVRARARDRELVDERGHEQRVLTDPVPLTARQRVQDSVGPEDLVVGQV